MTQKIMVTKEQFDKALQDMGEEKIIADIEAFVNGLKQPSCDDPIEFLAPLVSSAARTFSDLLSKKTVNDINSGDVSMVFGGYGCTTDSADDIYEIEITARLCK